MTIERTAIIAGVVVSVLAFLFGQDVFPKFFGKNHIILSMMAPPSPVGTTHVLMENPKESRESCEEARFMLETTNAIPIRFLVLNTTENKKRIQESIVLEKRLVAFSAPRFPRSGHIKGELSYKAMQGNELNTDLKVTCARGALFEVRKSPLQIDKARGAPTPYTAYSVFFSIAFGVIGSLIAAPIISGLKKAYHKIR